MIRFIRKNWNRYFAATAIILNYQGTVKRSPEFRSAFISGDNLDIQLQVLAAEWKVVPLAELVHAHRKRKLRKKTVALVFDGAYADDVDLALTALRKHRLPASFLFTEAVLAGDSISWEDELERLILYSRHLPPVVSLRFGEEKFSFDVSRETVLTDNIRAQYENPGKPGLRIQLYQQLHSRLLKGTKKERHALIGNLRNLTSIVSRDMALYRPLTVEQIKEIDSDPSFLVGLHIPILAEQGTDIVSLMSDQLRSITGKRANLLSINAPIISEEIIQDLKGKGIDILVLKKEMALKQGLELIVPGRFVVKNYNLYVFRKILQQWTKATQS